MTERTKYELGDFNSKTSEYDEVTCDCGRFTFKTFLPIYDERGIAEESYFCDCGIIYHWAYGNVVEKVDNGIDWLLKRAEDASLAESNLSAVRRHISEVEQRNKRYRETIKSVRSEIKYALYSNKSEDVKRHYLQNAEREATEALEEMK